MFPTSSNYNLTTNSDTKDTSKITFEFDFETGQHIIIDGKLKECSSPENIKQFITTLLETEVDKYQVYNDDSFGLTIHRHIGSRFTQAGYIISELKREIEEQVKSLEEVADINNFQTWFENRDLCITFDVLLENGEILSYSNKIGGV